MRIAKGVLNRRLRKIRCLLLDVDGVLTDGKLHFTSAGREFKTFDAQDGHGIAMARRGDLVLIQRARDYSLGLVDLSGSHIAVLKAKGIERIPLDGLSAWHV